MAKWLSECKGPEDIKEEAFNLLPLSAHSDTALNCMMGVKIWKPYLLEEKLG